MPALIPILSGIWSFASSQIGVLIIASLLSFGYGHHRASVACAEREAAASARATKIHLEEMARQAKAAETIQLADRNRAAEASKAGEAMQVEIENLKSDLSKKKGASDAKAGSCVIDDAYVKRVQRLDRSGRH